MATLNFNIESLDQGYVLTTGIKAAFASYGEVESRITAAITNELEKIKRTSVTEMKITVTIEENPTKELNNAIL